MESKHTPGPWSIHPYMKDNSIVVDNDDGTFRTCHEYTIGVGEMIIGSVESSSDGGRAYPRVDSRAEAEANAHLITAAPELLLLVQSYREALEDGPENMSFDSAMALEESASRIIAKATGEGAE